MNIALLSIATLTVDSTSSLQQRPWKTEAMEADALALREAGLALQNRAAATKRKVEDDDEPLLLCIASAALAVAAAVLGEQEDNDEDHMKGPRKKRAPRRVFDIWGAWDNIKRDYLGERALFDGEFRKSFRLSRSRVEMIIQDLGSSGDPFFQTFRRDKFGRQGPSVEAKVLLPLISIAYGDPPHTFCAYFQVSTPMARECYKHFLAAIVKLYGDEYLRIPTANDLKSVTTLHKHVHGVEGMIGSLDCMQTKWKNCPVAWQQSFKGRNKGSCNIVLEAAADHFLWFWHVSYGYSGALNDVNILNLSPLLDRLTDGSFTTIEAESGVVPYQIGTAEFQKTFLLVDGIYPSYSRFVKCIKQPITPKERRFTAWQESARKDIERAFGVLQCRFKALAVPIQTMDTEIIANLAGCCLVLHNMCVSERVMGGVGVKYDPGLVVEEAEAEEEVIEDALEFPEGVPRPRTAGTQPPPAVLIQNFDQQLAATVVRNREWRDLKNEDEWRRLQVAILEDKGKRSI
jgi:hypothetical protein